MVGSGMLSDGLGIILCPLIVSLISSNVFIDCPLRTSAALLSSMVSSYFEASLTILSKFSMSMAATSLLANIIFSSI